MNKFKCFISKIKIKSLYIKWTLLFTVFIMIAQSLTFACITYFIVPNIISKFSIKLEKKAEFLLSLHENNLPITENVFKDIGDDDIILYIIDTEPVAEELGKYSDTISLNMLQRAYSGEIVIADSDAKYIGRPFCLVAINGTVYLLTPNFFNDEVSHFISGMKTSILLGAVTGSILIVLALIVIIRPIKKVSLATKEVAKGNFNVELKTKSIDEIGQLITNFDLMTKELQNNEYLRKDFVSSISHEFKTPITSIKGFAKLLKNENITSEQFKDYTDIILKETSRLSNLSENLLKLSLLDSTGFEPVKKAYYLDEQIRNIILLLEKFWEAKEIEFDLEMEDILLDSNEELLSQVWINLIQNAIKFSPIGGLISISIKVSTENIVVEVRDQGPGIADKDKENIFNRFYKADKSRSGEGNGLGLSIVKRVLETVKGTIRFENNESFGTTFYVTLPK